MDNFLIMHDIYYAMVLCEYYYADVMERSKEKKIRELYNSLMMMILINQIFL